MRSWMSELFLTAEPIMAFRRQKLWSLILEVGEEAETEDSVPIADGLCCISFALEVSHFEQCCRASVGSL